MLNFIQNKTRDKKHAMKIEKNKIKIDTSKMKTAMGANNITLANNELSSQVTVDKKATWLTNLKYEYMYMNQWKCVCT